MHPGEKILHETFRQTYLFMQAAEEKTPKQFANRGRIERGEFEKLPFGSPDAVGNDGVAMRIKVVGPSMGCVWLRPGINPNNTVTERLAWRGPIHSAGQSSDRRVTRGAREQTRPELPPPGE